MIDMTLNPEDRASFITSISMDENTNSYVVTYANGDIVFDECISDHNDQVYLNKMKEQYLKYKDDFVKDIGLDCIKLYAGKASSIILTIAGFIFDYNIDVHIAIKIFIGLGILGISFIYNYINKAKLVYNDKLLQHVDVMDYLSKHMEDYYGKIELEETGEVKEAQIINFNNVEAFSSIDSMNRMYEALVYEESDMKKGK